MTASYPDRPGRLRDEDAFDPARVLFFLRAIVPDLPDGPIELQQFAGGASNRTYLLTVGAHELILRRPPAGGSSGSAHDLSREMRVLSALAPHFPCPRPLGLCDDESLIGSSFLVMEKVDGMILRRDLPDGFHYSERQARQLCENLFDTLLRLHTIDYTSVGLADLGQPQGYVERQIRGWCERFEKARTDDAPHCDALMAWLRRHMPSDSPRPGLIHNDYRFDNVVLRGDGASIARVLDWEMCTVGDPLMDLGSSLAYWIQSDDPESLQKLRMQPSHLPGMMTRDEIVQRYCNRSGRRVDCFDFYYVFGLFRLAVIAQQIYRRSKSALQRNPRFEAFGLFASILVQHAERVVSRSRL